MELRGLSVGYGRGSEAVYPLTRFDLAVSPGELTVVLGVSGSGKTTLMNVVAGFLRPGLRGTAHIEGTVFFSGRDCTDLEPRQRPIGLVMQEYNLYPHLSVRDNLVFPLKVRGLSLGRAQEDERVHRIARTLFPMRPPEEVSLLLRRPVTQLSGGEAQRVAIGKMLVHDPQLALFDEAFSKLDAVHKDELWKTLVLPLRAQGRGVIFVTHDLLWARDADKIVVVCQNRSGAAPGRMNGHVFESAGPSKAWAAFVRAAHDSACVRELVQTLPAELQNLPE